MPSRILKESICTSETIEQLSPVEEIMFYRLLVNCDDYGRMDGRPSILKARLFPLRDIRLDQISASLKKLASVELVTLYEVDGKPFVQTVSWEKHQQIRAKKSKFPAPPNHCNHLISDDIKCSRNPIQNESESESQSEAETHAPATTPTTISQPFITEDDARAYRKNMTDIEILAQSMGLPWKSIDHEYANVFLADYGREWLLEAMKRTSMRPEKARSWGYVQGILKDWKQKGGMDDAAAPKADPFVGKKVSTQNYTQRQYPEIDMAAQARKLVAESANFNTKE